MPVTDELGTRMKENYEQVAKTRLLKRTPVVLRLDGKAFHTFTRGFQKPFDEVLMNSMQETMKALCENIQGCVLGYTQSDEITLVLIDYKTFETQSWFDYEVQKMCSISASMATYYFNEAFKKNVTWWTQNAPIPNGMLKATYDAAVLKGAFFDSRCFNVPREEVTNCVYWRQQDATRNSIQMVGQANFSHKELQNKSCSDIQEKLFSEKGINWNDFPTECKRGTCCIKQEEEEILDSGEKITRHKWVIDKEIPIFKGEGRDYIEKLLYPDEE